MIRTLSLAFSLHLVAATVSAAGVEVAAPLEGRMVAAGGSVVSNGEGFLAQWSVEGGWRFVTAIDREGRRIRSAVGVRPGCGNPMAFQSGYIVTCFESAEVTIRRLDQHGAEAGVIPVDPPLTFARVIATNGDRILIASGSGHSELRVVDGSGRQIGSTIARPGTALVAAEPSRSGFVVLSAEFGGLRLDTISREGAPRHQATFSPEDYNSIAMAAIGDDVIVAWSGWRGAVSTAAISETGVVTMRSWVEFGMDVVKLVSHGDSVLLIGRRRQSHPRPGAAAVGRLARDATSLAPAVTIESDVPMNGVAVNNDFLYIVGQRDRDVVGISVPLSALSSPPREEILSIGPLPQQAVRAAVVGDAVLVLWREEAADAASIRARFVRNGEPIGNTIAVATTSIYGWGQAAGSNGSMALVVWTDRKQIQAKRIDAAGSVVDHGPLLIAPQTSGHDYGSISVASDGRDFVVTWVEAYGGNSTIMAAVVARDGAIGPARAVAEPLDLIGRSGQWYERKALSLEWAGDRYVLMWTHEQWRRAIYSYLELRELRMMAFDRDATTTRSSETVVAPDLAGPQIAAGPGFLGVLALQPDPHQSEQHHPVTLLVDPTSGSVVAQHPLGRGQPFGRSGLGAAAWTGHEFALAWHNGRASYLTRLTIGGTPRHSFLANHPSEVTLAVAPDGSVEYLAVERRVTLRVVTYRDGDFTPLVTTARPRAVRR